MYKPALIGLAFLVGFLLFQQFGRDLVPATTPGAQSLSAQLAEGARKLNASAPLRVDELTTLISAEADGDKLVYNYRLGQAARNIDTKRLRKEQHRVLSDRVCNDRNTKYILDAGGELIFNYRDAKEAPILSISMTGTNCR